MKIAMLTSDGREVCRAYEKEEPGIAPAPEALLQGFAGMSGVEIHVLVCAQRSMKSPAKLAENIFLHCLTVPKIGWLRTGYQGCIRAVRRKLREIRPDIVHGQGTERDCAMSAVFSGYPNVLTIHGNMRLIAAINRARPFTFQWFSAQLEKFTIPRSNGVVCITSYTREAVVSLARKTWIVPNAVDSSFFEIERKPMALPQLVCVANVDKRKNQNALIRALDALQPQGKFELVFFGGANRSSTYGREFFELVEARPWCRYGGFVDRAALRQHLSTATGLVLASLEDNCPMVILEAMAAGISCAAAQVGGVPELIRLGETGWLFNPLSQESMATAVGQLLGDRDRSMAARAQGEARKRFHPKVIAERHVEIYREVLSAPGR